MFFESKCLFFTGTRRNGQFVLVVVDTDWYLPSKLAQIRTIHNKFYIDVHSQLDEFVGVEPGGSGIEPGEVVKALIPGHR